MKNILLIDGTAEGVFSDRHIEDAGGGVREAAETDQEILPFLTVPFACASAGWRRKYLPIGSRQIAWQRIIKVWSQC